jgi:hypothetical protein
VIVDGVVVEEPGHRVTGQEQIAFVVSLGFGAPLLEITKHGGVLFNAYSPRSGVGKSTAAHWMASIYGSFSDMRVSQASTMNMKIESIGKYKHLPFFMDEITNIDPKVLSDLAYQISDGKGRGRLSASAEIKQTASWNTFVLSTSNLRLHDKLGLAKSNSEAEAARVFEFEFVRNEDFSAKAADLNRFLDDNYGLVGEEYIKYLVANRASLRPQVIAVADWLRKELNAKDSERFWIDGAACALLGAHIARQLGLIKYDPMRLVAWIRKQRDRMVEDLDERQVKTGEVLGRFLNEHRSYHAIVKEDRSGSEVVTLPLVGRRAWLCRVCGPARMIATMRGLVARG